MGRFLLSLEKAERPCINYWKWGLDVLSFELFCVFLKIQLPYRLCRGGYYQLTLQIIEEQGLVPSEALFTSTGIAM